MTDCTFAIPRHTRRPRARPRPPRKARRPPKTPAGLRKTARSFPASVAAVSASGSPASFEHGADGLRRELLHEPFHRRRFADAERRQVACADHADVGGPDGDAGFDVDDFRDYIDFGLALVVHLNRTVHDDVGPELLLNLLHLLAGKKPAGLDPLLPQESLNLALRHDVENPAV